MQAVIVGTNWGLVHLYALRQLGVEVVALCGLDRGKVAEVAAQHQVPLALDSLAAVRELAPDLVSIATPAATHAELLQALAPIPLICEKPLFGLHPAQPFPELHSPVWVNYAFAFLQTAQCVQALRPHWGRIHQIRLLCTHDLPLNFSAAGWWLEVGSHPLSFLAHLCGEPEWCPATSVRQGTRLSCRMGGIPAELDCCHEPGLNGIRQQFWLTTEQGEVTVSGRYQVGDVWRYAPVCWNGVAQNEGEGGDTDCWFQANLLSLAHILQQLRGEQTRLQGLQQGLFNAEKAWPIDQLIMQAFH